MGDIKQKECFYFHKALLRKYSTAFSAQYNTADHMRQQVQILKVA